MSEHLNYRKIINSELTTPYAMFVRPCDTIFDKERLLLWNKSVLCYNIPNHKPEIFRNTYRLSVAFLDSDIPGSKSVLADELEQVSVINQLPFDLDLTEFDEEFASFFKIMPELS